MIRRRYAAAALVLLLLEVGIALWVDDRVIRPYLGDSLAVVLVHCGVCGVTRWRWPAALGVALTVATLVELGQLAGVLDLLGLREVKVARVVLGSGFDLRDFVAYALGGVAVVLFERQRAH